MVGGDGKEEMRGKKRVILVHDLIRAWDGGECDEGSGRELICFPKRKDLCQLCLMGG